MAPPPSPSPPLSHVVLHVETARRAAGIVAAVDSLPFMLLLYLVVEYCRGRRRVTSRTLIMLFVSLIDTATDLLFVLRSKFASRILFVACCTCTALPVLAYVLTAPGLFLNWRRIYAAFFFFDPEKHGLRTLWNPFQPDDAQAAVFKLWRVFTLPLGRPGVAVYCWAASRFGEHTSNAAASGRRCPLWMRSMDSFLLVGVLALLKMTLFLAGAAYAALALVPVFLVTLPIMLLWLFALGPVLFRTELLASGRVAHLFFLRPDLGDKPLEPRVYNARAVAFCLLESVPQLIIQTWNSKRLAVAGQGTFSVLTIVSVSCSGVNVLATMWHIVANCVEFGASFEEWDGVEQQETEFSTKRNALVAGFLCCTGVTGSTAATARSTA